MQGVGFSTFVSVQLQLKWKSINYISSVLSPQAVSQWQWKTSFTFRGEKLVCHSLYTLSMNGKGLRSQKAVLQEVHVGICDLRSSSSTVLHCSGPASLLRFAGPNSKKPTTCRLGKQDCSLEPSFISIHCCFIYICVYICVCKKEQHIQLPVQLTFSIAYLHHS